MWAGTVGADSVKGADAWLVLPCPISSFGIAKLLFPSTMEMGLGCDEVGASAETTAAETLLVFLDDRERGFEAEDACEDIRGV